MLFIKAESKKERPDRDAGKVEDFLTSRILFGQKKKKILLKNQKKSVNKKS